MDLKALLDPEFWRSANENAQGLLGQPVVGLNQFAGLLSGTITPEEFGAIRANQVADQLKPSVENMANFLAGGMLGTTSKAALKSSTRLLEAAPNVKYRGSHTAPDKVRGAPAHDLTADAYPDDIYSPMAAQYYGDFGQNHPMDVQTVKLLQSLRGKPDATVTVYRAAPKEYASVINPGDWVTPSRRYARNHGESVLEGQYKIISKQVRAKDIYTDGNSIYEFGYDPTP